MTAKEYLSRYRALNSRIECKSDEIRHLRELATRLSPTAMFDKNGNVSDKVGSAASRIVDLERKIEGEASELVAIRDEITGTISAVEDERLRELLTMRYINGYGWQKIAFKMHYSVDHVACYMHRKALRDVSKILKVNGF